MKKIIGIILGVSGIILLFFGVFTIVSILFSDLNTAIIGGADTPTFMLIIHNSSVVLSVIGGIVGLLLIILSCILLFKRKR